ncbi:MAG: ABC transporter permease [Candidatus Sumerlaeaceae bacterium]|nr:ABC transporter permease [Candidatus Sumerlaeaceae bacterium]
MKEFFLSLKVVWRKLKRDRSAMVGLCVAIGLVCTALISVYVAPFDRVIQQDLPKALQPPSAEHWFGTDYLGRDVFLRILYGSRISLVVGIVVVGIGMSIGLLLGTSAGYFGGWWDAVVMRLTDIMLAFPFLLLAIALTAVLGKPSLTNTILALGVASFPSYTRLVRGNVLSLREESYVDAARVCGASHNRIMWRHLMPNLMGTLIVYGTLRISTAILAEAGLSYLGLGAQLPTPTWGNMLSDGRDFIIFFEWLPLFPGLAILLTVAGFNLLGDGLRDALDPKTRR